VADNRYVVIDYVESGYDEVQNTAWYIESDYFELGYVIQGITQSGEAAVSAASVVTSTADRVRNSSADLISASTTSATTLRIKSALATLSSASTLSAATAVVRSGQTNLQSEFSLAIDADELSSAVLSAFTNASLVSSASVNRPAESTITVIGDLVVAALRIKPASTSLSAFNTVVTVSARIRSTQGDMFVATTFSATPVKVFGASTRESSTGLNFDGSRFLKISPTPQLSYTNGAKQQFTYSNNTNVEKYASAVGKDFIVSVWVRVDPALNRGTLFSTDMTNETGFLDAQNQWSFRFTGLSGNNHTTGGTTNSSIDLGMSQPPVPGVPGSGGYGMGVVTFPDSEWHHYAAHILQMDVSSGGFSPTYTSIARFYRDGVFIGDGVSGQKNPQGAYLVDPLYVGVNKRYGGGASPVGWIMDNLFKGDMKQIWIGYDGPTFNYTFDIRDFYNANVSPGSGNLPGYVDLGKEGRTGAVNQLPIPIAYNPLDYYTLDTYGETVSVHQFSNAYSNIGNVTTLDSSWIPSGVIRGFDSRFTFTAIGDNIVGLEASITSEFTISSEFGYIFPNSANISIVSSLTGTMTDVFPSTANLSSEFAFTANSYEFTKASATLSSAFAFTADTDEISSGELLGPIEFTLSASLTVIRRSANSNFFSELNIVADSTTNSLGIVNMDSVFAVEVIPRVTYPIRPESMTMSAAFSLAADSRRYRDSPVPMASAFTFSNGVTRALRGGNISMSAFDTVLSAGKIVEFLLENTIAVTEEQRLLRVALESTVLLVQMANGVNTITAETTDIVVPQEQGRLLAQYNQPTN
jgi:hypothetical protein